MPRTRFTEAWPALAIVCIALLRPQLAEAADREQILKQLRVEPGATCLSIEQLAEEVHKLTGDEPIADDFVFVVDGSPIDPRSVRLSVVRGQGTIARREFDPGPSRCSHLHAAVGLSIALAIKAAPPPAKQAKEPRPWAISGSGVWSYRLMPQFAPGLELLARRSFGQHVLLRAGALGIAGFDASLGAGAGTFDALLIAVRADGCGRLALGANVHAAGCVGLIGGAFEASGDASSAVREASATVPWLALAGGAELSLALSERWALVLGFTTTLLLHRLEVGVESTDGDRVSSRELARVAFAAGLGPLYSF